MCDHAFTLAGKRRRGKKSTRLMVFFPPAEDHHTFHVLRFCWPPWDIIFSPAQFQSFGSRDHNDFSAGLCPLGRKIKNTKKNIHENIDGGIFFSRLCLRAVECDSLVAGLGKQLPAWNLASKFYVVSGYPLGLFFWFHLCMNDNPLHLAGSRD